MSGEGPIRQKVTVVGGFYAELCRFPEFSECYGSGGRGAAAMPKSEVDVELFTFADERNLPSLLALAEASNFKPIIEKIESIYRFEYLHPLSVPVFLYPQNKPERPLEVKSDIVLCYGMMEGQPLVLAKTAVFDPQSHREAKLFSSNGSKADRLAIIANFAEATLLTGEKDEQRAAEKLLAMENASVVVVKCGHKGALVASESGMDWIPAFQTERVFKIGSGDVFSSIFTYAWAIKGMIPTEAAMVASRSTAYYCNCRALPIPWPLPEGFTPSLASRPATKRKAYLAGPFFTPQDLWMVEECKRLLTDFGVDVFSPFHSIGLGQPGVVAWADLKGLDDSDFVFAIIDKFDPGTVFEIGYAIAKRGKPVIALYHGYDECNLTMLKGTECRIFGDIASAIYAAISA